MIQKLRNYDFTLIITPILLAAFGMVMIYSASMVTAVVEGHGSTYYLFKQIQWFGLGLISFVICSIFPYKYYQKLIKVIVLFVIILLVGLFLFGTNVNNANSWYVFGPVSLQPAEFAKLGIIMYLASVYSKRQAYINEFSKAVVPPLLLSAIIIGLIVMQPGLGTAFIIFVIACSVIFSSGIRFKHLFILIGIGITILVVSIPKMVTDVRVARFTGAYQPFQTPDTGGYHLIQSYLAIGGGGLTGEGLGQSVQKLGYLMEAHTDFIMAVIAEELGFFGVIIVIGMIATIVLRGMYISRKCKDSFGALLAIGISTMVGIQAFVNLGAISGVLPITGVTLPFISYGGSSLLVLMTSMGILNNVAVAVKKGEQDIELGNTKRNHIRKVVKQNRGGKAWVN